MPASAIASASSASAPIRTGVQPWAYAIGGMLAGGSVMLAVWVVASAPASLFLGLGGVAAQRAETTVFDQPVAGRMQVLRGVNGETLTLDKPAGDQLAALPAGAALAAKDVTPAALDRLSAGDCVSLTTVSGQKLSFRILGTHGAVAQRNRPATATIDLDVTACAPGSEVILKAVIESKADGKQSAVQRNL
jgi:hypothetical protein